MSVFALSDNERDVPIENFAKEFSKLKSGVDREWQTLCGSQASESVHKLLSILGGVEVEMDPETVAASYTSIADAFRHRKSIK